VSNQAGPVRQIFSDAAGRYEIPDLPRGRYYLTAVNPADAEQYSESVEVDLSRTFSGRISANIYLRSGVKVEPAKEGRSASVTVAEASHRVPREAQKAMEKALKFRATRKLAEALATFNRSVEIYPDFFQAITERGHLRVSMGQIAEARKDFSRALEINGGYAPALRGAGICEFAEGNHAEAIRDLERAVSGEPRDAIAFLFLGLANIALNRGEAARAALEKALSIDPKSSVRAHVHLANLDLKENRAQEAAAELEAYLAAVPDAADAERLRLLLAEIRAQTRKD
jgi:tetratricopeptide (TPR) repeat protein